MHPVLGNARLLSQSSEEVTSRHQSGDVVTVIAQWSGSPQREHLFVFEDGSGASSSRFVDIGGRGDEGGETPDGGSAAVWQPRLNVLSFAPHRDELLEWHPDQPVAFVSDHAGEG